MRLLSSLALAFAIGSSLQAGDVPGLAHDQPASGPFVAINGGYMVPYTVTIPGTKVTFEMVPVPGGEFLMGSPETETGRNANEGPQIRIKTRPFWMQKNEVCWAEYKEYMGLYNVFKKFETAKIRPVTDANKIDAITAPTELYMPDFTFEFGEDPDLPAVSMTLYAARQYTKWLSAVTGQQYRVPTEAEWEYAARAGSQTAYSFGDAPSPLKDHAWYAETSMDTGPRKVGQGRPNAFGLCDMHGNVAEWVQDELLADGYASLRARADAGPLSPLEVLGRPKTHDSRVVKGGAWSSPAAECRSASRLGSVYEDWKLQDPNLPKSPWWMTDDPCRSIGFRLLRSIDELPREQIELYWNIDSESLQLDVDGRVPGRGVYGIVDPALPTAVQQLKGKK
ncbi:MAG: formylglycine-generating enzyme family protein [Planctomycetota bacterium]|nr:MAG: formylglycine-generating enzyme family protein [Planctomycetota bacterium]